MMSVGSHPPSRRLSSSTTSTWWWWIMLLLITTSTTTTTTTTTTTLFFAAAQVECGPDGTTLSIAGSSTVQPLAQAWANGYTTMCPNITVTVAGGGSTSGARQVCNVTQPAVDIGNMSRDWRIGSEVNVSSESSSKKFVCNQGDLTRRVTQVDVAIDGITIAAVASGVAANCFRSLEGRGLKIDQLRWMFSNFTVSQLRATGTWDINVIPFVDARKLTHNFTELSNLPACNAGLIRLAAPGALSGTFDFFREVVLTATTEGLAKEVFTSEDDDVLVDFLLSTEEAVFGDSVGFFGYSYFAAEGSFLYGVPIKAKGGVNYHSPNIENIEAGVYEPFARRIFMNVLDDSIASTGPFISYGFSQEGIQKLREANFIPPPPQEITGLLARIGRDPSPTSPPTTRPTRAPVTAPTNAPVFPKCGVLGLSLFCPLTGCGFWGRLFGACSL